MAIVKMITSGDIGGGLAIVANKLVPVVDGTSIQLDGSNQLSTVIDPSVINNLVLLSGLAADTTDLGVFTGGLVADNLTVKAAIQALESAVESINITGEYAGSAATFAALPMSTVNTITGGTNPVNAGDWSILSVDDGGNESGIYAYSGSAWELAKEIPEVFNLVVATTNSASIAFTGDGNVTNLSATLVVDGLAGNLLAVTASGAKVDPAAVKAALVFDNELQDLASNTLGYFSSSTTFA